MQLYSTARLVLETRKKKGYTEEAGPTKVEGRVWE